jgi:hypothetical protein
MSRRLRAHLERRLAATEAEPTTGQKIGGILMGLGGDYAGQRRAFHPGEADAGVSQEVAAYLATRGKGDAAAIASELRARDAETRAGLAERRLLMDDTYRRLDADRKAADEARKDKLLPSLIEQREANVALKGALTRKASAQAKAAASGPAPGSTTDVRFDGEEFAYSRPHPDKQLARANQKSMFEKAAGWGQVVKQSESLADAIERWAKAPSIEARNRVLEEVTFASQGLTYALGGGAMQDAERRAAIQALGGGLTDASQVVPFIRGLVGGDDTESARAMAQRARDIKPLAHQLLRGFADSLGYDVRPSAPPQPQEAPPPLDQPAAPGAPGGAVEVVEVATGKRKRVSAGAAAVLERAGKVRRP